VQTLTVPTSYPGILLVPDDGENYVIINTDQNNGVTLGSSIAISSQDTVNVITLNAGQNITVDGSKEVWGVAQNADVIVYVVQGGTASFPSVSTNGPEFIVNKEGLFVYSVHKGFGKLIGNFVPDDVSTDPFGNTTIPILGVFTEDQNIFFSVQFGTVVIAKVGGGDLPPNISVIDATVPTGTTTINPTNIQTPYIVATHPGTSNTTETPQNMPGMSNSWSIAGSAHYRYNPSQCLEVSFVNLAPGTKTDNTLLWAAGTFPSAYRVPIAKYVPITVTGGFPPAASFSPALLFNTDGSVACVGINNASVTRIDCHAILPLTI
jgi:hypothetical protein